MALLKPKSPVDLDLKKLMGLRLVEIAKLLVEPALVGRSIGLVPKHLAVFQQGSGRGGILNSVYDFKGMKCRNLLTSSGDLFTFLYRL